MVVKCDENVTRDDAENVWTFESNGRVCTDLTALRSRPVVPAACVYVHGVHTAALSNKVGPANRATPLDLSDTARLMLSDRTLRYSTIDKLRYNRRNGTSHGKTEPKLFHTINININSPHGR